MGQKRGKYNVKYSMKPAAMRKRAQRNVKARKGEVRHHRGKGDAVKVMNRKTHAANHRRRKDGSQGGRPRKR